MQNFLPSSLLSKNIKIKMYRTIIFPVILYGCEIWSLTLNVVRRLRFSEKNVLRRIFDPRRNELTGEWKNLQNEVLNDLYSSSNIIQLIKSRIMRLMRYVACMEDSRVVYRVSVGKPEAKRPHGRSRRRWEDNIKMDLQEIGREEMD